MFFLVGKIIEMTICECNIVNPRGIHLVYKDISTLVPTPLFIKKIKIKKTILEYPRLTRDRFENLNERFNYNKKKIVTFKDVFLKQHKQNMQETFYIIKKLTPHNKKKNKCNNRVFEIQYDINGNIGIMINFEKQLYDSEDEEEEIINKINENQTVDDEKCEFNFSYDDYINIGDDDGMYDDTFGDSYELTDLDKELMDLK